MLPKTVYTEGQKFLTSFIYDGSVHYTYETDNFFFEKHITLKRNANVCAVAYELTAGDARLYLYAHTAFQLPRAQ